MHSPPGRSVRSGTDATSDAIAGLVHADPATALVMVRRLAPGKDSTVAAHQQCLKDGCCSLNSAARPRAQVGNMPSWDLRAASSYRKSIALFARLAALEAGAWGPPATSRLPVSRFLPFEQGALLAWDGAHSCAIPLPHENQKSISHVSR
jgi:hypothetical protein